MIRLKLLWAGAALAATVSVHAMAQGGIVPGGSAPSGAGTGTVQSVPLAPPPGATAAEPKPDEAKAAEPKAAEPPAVSTPQTPVVTQTPAPAPAPPAAAPAGAVDPNATLAGKPGDSANIDDLTLVPKPAAVAEGKANWDSAAKAFSEVFAKMAAEAVKAGAKVAGRPVISFVETDDQGFRYIAYLPIDKSPDGKDALTADIKLGQTPEGRALRFTHKSAYDDIDSTYEAITAYLEAKGVTVHDAFIEEYVGDLKDMSESDFEVNIYVQPR